MAVVAQKIVHEYSDDLHLKASAVAVGPIDSRQTLNAKRRSEACSPSSRLCSAFSH
jgi:hypothetical protein